MKTEKKIKCWVILEKKFDVEVDIFRTQKEAADCAAEWVKAQKKKGGTIAYVIRPAELIIKLQ